MSNSIMDKINSGREYRRMELAVETQAADAESYNVRGYATTFDEPYLLLSDAGFKFYEVVDKRAFEGCDMSDVIMQYDHEGRVFARTSNSTLSLNVDEHGLLVNAYLGGTEIGRALFGEIKGGYTNKMSFGFRVGADDINERDEDGITIYTRRITAFSKLYDVSAVSIPANDGTEISARSLRDGEIARLQAERLARAEKRKAIEELKARVDMLLGKEKA